MLCSALVPVKARRRMQSYTKLNGVQHKLQTTACKPTRLPYTVAGVECCVTLVVTSNLLLQHAGLSP